MKNIIFHGRGEDLRKLLTEEGNIFLDILEKIGIENVYICVIEHGYKECRIRLSISSSSSLTHRAMLELLDVIHDEPNPVSLLISTNSQVQDIIKGNKIVINNVKSCLLINRVKIYSDIYIGGLIDPPYYLEIN